MGIETAAIIGGATLVGGVLQAGAARRGARAAESAAEAQLAEQRRAQGLALEFAEFSPEEIANLQRAVEVNEQDIARKTELLASVDPALIEAGNQALQLLQGEEARTLDPIRRQRQDERTRLEDQLRSQLGAGFETSTAGIQALNDFDAETGSLLAVEQDRSLGRLLGVSQNVAGLSSLGQNIAAAGSLANLFGEQSRRQVAAITGAPITQAGAQFTGDVLGGQIEQRLIGDITGGITRS